MEPKHTNTETITSPTDYFGVLGDIMIRHLLDEMKPKDPCENCQEFDCFGCEYKEVKRRHE